MWPQKQLRSVLKTKVKDTAKIIGYEENSSLHMKVSLFKIDPTSLKA